MRRLVDNFSLLLTIATCWMVFESRCWGERTAPIDYFDIPVQSYAVVNLSAGKPSGSEVDSIALDDSGNAAFGYKAAGPDEPEGGHTETLQIQKWKNGQLVEGAKLRLVGSMRVNASPPWNNDTPNGYVSLDRVRLLADGTLYGNIEWRLATNVYTLDGEGSCYRCELTPTGGALPPLFLGSYAAVYPPASIGYTFTEDSAYPQGPKLAAVSTGGKTAGTFGVFRTMKSRPPMLPAPPGGKSSVSPSGTDPVTWVGGKVFDDRTYVNYVWDPHAGEYGETTGEQACVPDIPSADFVNKYFPPKYINDNGWALGENDQDGSDHYGDNYIYNADQNKITALEGLGTALNNNNDILAAAGRPYLIEKGQVAMKKHFLGADSADQGLIPAKFQSELRAIYPYLMSNRIPDNDPAARPAKPILNIVFTAQVRRSVTQDVWEQSNFLLREFNDGSTDLHEITGLENKWIVSINASGVLAVIGDPDGDTGPTATSDALLLLPVEVNCPELYMFSGHSGDKVELCKVSGIACEWKLKDATPAIGTFNHPTDSACSFTATGPGKNTIQLLVGGKVAWEKPTEILDLKNRAAWGAETVDMSGMSGVMRNPPGSGTPLTQIPGLTYHHSANQNDGIAEIQRIQREHKSEFPYWLHENWGDIGYHFVIAKDGTAYIGRELEAEPGSLGGPYTLGADVKNNNTAAGIGICLLGNYDTETLSLAHQKHLEETISAICRRYKLAASSISFHAARSVTQPTTHCPGANVIAKSEEIEGHVRQNLQ